MNQGERAAGLGGGAVWAAWITGFLSLLGAAVAAVSGEWVGVGLCLIASAIAFSGVASAILRR